MLSDAVHVRHSVMPQSVLHDVLWLRRTTQYSDVLRRITTYYDVLRHITPYYDVLLGLALGLDVQKGVIQDFTKKTILMMES